MSIDRDLPFKSGGIAAYATYYYKYGQYGVGHTIIYQDTEGRIVQNYPGKPSSVNDIIVNTDRNPSKNGFALVGWNPDVQGPGQLELRLYWVNTSGQIFERCFSRNGGPNATWYDGTLTGQFVAARYSSIAANTQSGFKTRVYFQEAATNNIRELYKESGDTFDQFHLVEKQRPDALKGTWIATDSNNNGVAEVYYQSPNSQWVIDGTSVKYPDTGIKYNAGAPIAVAGSIDKGGARVFTVNSNDRLVVTVYDKNSSKWSEPTELVKVKRDKQVWALNHPPQYASSLFRHPTTVFVSQSTYKWDAITRVGFTNPTAQGWDVLPADNVPIS